MASRNPLLGHIFMQFPRQAGEVTPSAEQAGVGACMHPYPPHLHPHTSSRPQAALRESRGHWGEREIGEGQTGSMDSSRTSFVPTSPLPPGLQGPSKQGYEDTLKLATVGEGRGSEYRQKEPRRVGFTLHPYGAPSPLRTGSSCIVANSSAPSASFPPFSG